MEGKTIGLSVVIPTYNEEKNILGTLRQIEDFFDAENYDPEVIVSDDGSIDETIKIVKDYLKKSKVPLILLENKHMGKGPAVKSGVEKASKELILYMDADFATPIKEVKRLMVWIKEQNFDIAIASREGLGALRKGEPYYRHLMGRVFNFLVQLLALPGISDSQCGFKLFKKNVAKKVFGLLKEYAGKSVLKKAYLGAFDVELLLIARILGYRIKEVPVYWTYHKTKRLSVFRDSLKMFLDVAKIRLNALKGAYK